MFFFARAVVGRWSSRVLSNSLSADRPTDSTGWWMVPTEPVASLLFSVFNGCCFFCVFFSQRRGIASRWWERKRTDRSEFNQVSQYDITINIMPGIRIYILLTVYILVKMVSAGFYLRACHEFFFNPFAHFISRDEGTENIIKNKFIFWRRYAMEGKMLYR